MFFLGTEIFDLTDDYRQIHSEDYPRDLRSNCEYIWNIYMNDSNEFQVIVHDVDLDFEQDYLQIITGNCSVNFVDLYREILSLALDELIYSLTTPKSYRISSNNQTKILLRTKHTQLNRYYRGFNLTYQSRR